jgi:succinate-acetate transporter protein
MSRSPGLVAGMWDFRNNNTFGATCFSTYGGFWFSLATYIILDLLGLIPAGQNVSDSLGWFLVAFFIFVSPPSQLTPTSRLLAFYLEQAPGAARACPPLCVCLCLLPGPS